MGILREFYFLSHNVCNAHELKTQITINTAKIGHISNKSTGSSEAVAALLFVDRNLVVRFPRRVTLIVNSIKILILTIHDWDLKFTFPILAHPEGRIYPIFGIFWIANFIRNWTVNKVSQSKGWILSANFVF